MREKGRERGREINDQRQRWAERRTEMLKGWDEQREGERERRKKQTLEREWSI